MTNSKNSQFGGIVFILSFVTILLALVYFQAMQEAAAYNRLTGSNVTAWDALFVELRVDGQVKSE